MLESCWFLISYSTSIIVPGWIIFTILISFSRIHGTIINVSWCRVWQVWFYMVFLLLSFRMSVRHRLLRPGTKEPWMMPFWKNTEFKWLVSVSIFDNRPVYFISTRSYFLEWTKKELLIYCNTHKKMERLEFLRLNINYDYNLSIGYVNVADQFQNQYCFYHWLQNFKWWRILFLWVM